MKTLLWISRHDYNKSQISQIESKLGELKVIKCPLSIQQDILEEILFVQPDIIVGIIPVTWISHFMKYIPKSTIWLKPKSKFVHSVCSANEPCRDFIIDTDIIINPSEKRYDDYCTRGDNIIHLRHNGYERIINSRDQLLFIKWK